MRCSKPGFGGCTPLLGERILAGARCSTGSCLPLLASKIAGYGREARALAACSGRDCRRPSPRAGRSGPGFRFSGLQRSARPRLLPFSRAWFRLAVRGARRGGLGPLTPVLLAFPDRALVRAPVRVPGYGRAALSAALALSEPSKVLDVFPGIRWLGRTGASKTNAGLLKRGPRPSFGSVVSAAEALGEQMRAGAPGLPAAAFFEGGGPRFRNPSR